MRKQAWFYLIGEDPKDIFPCRGMDWCGFSVAEYMEAYRDDHQIDVDVQRSFVFCFFVVLIR